MAYGKRIYMEDDAIAISVTESVHSPAIIKVVVSSGGVLNYIAVFCFLVARIRNMHTTGRLKHSRNIRLFISSTRPIIYLTIQATNYNSVAQTAAPKMTLKI